MNNIQKWFMIVALWTVILAVAFAFYWIQIRPVNIRRICARKAGEAAQQLRPNVSNTHEIYRAVYSDCCRSSGLKD